MNEPTEYVVPAGVRHEMGQHAQPDIPWPQYSLTTGQVWYEQRLDMGTYWRATCKCGASALVRDERLNRHNADTDDEVLTASFYGKNVPPCEHWLPYTETQPNSGATT